MNIQKRIYNIAEMLLVFMLGVISVSVLFLICGISISHINFFLPVFFMFYFRYKSLGGKEYFVQDCVSTLALLFFFILLSGSVYDNTWDGAAYHKTAVGLLKEGWNPFYMSADYFNSVSHSIEPARSNPLLWAEAYPKATWYFASTIYYLTDNIECGKCYTMIFAFITFGTCAEYFVKKTGKKRAYILSLAAALNPIVCDQFQTYYLDGVVACILTMLIIKFLELLNGVEKEKLVQKHYSIFALIAWGCNLKFNIALYIATICAVYCMCLSISKKKLQIRDTLILLMEGVVSIFVMGATPYITNIKRYGSIFYGFEGLLDEEMFQRTFGILGLDRVGRFWASVFGRTSHGQYTSLKEVLKIPFTFKKEELMYYSIPDARVGAFGVMFSGLFLVSMVVLVIVLIKKIKRREHSAAYLFTVMLWIISLAEFCIVPQTSQFRYIPHLYLVVIYALYYMMEFGGSRVLKIAYLTYVVAIAVNLLPWLNVAAQRMNDGIFTTATLKYMGERCRTDYISYHAAFHSDDFTGIVFNLKDNGIKYTYVDIIKIDPEYHATFSNWLYYKEMID